VACDRARKAAGDGAGVSADKRAEFTIRPATPADEPALLEIQHSSAIHHATIDPDRWRMQSIEEADLSRRHWHRILPRSEGLVAVANGRVVGMIELWLKRPKGPEGARRPRVMADLGLAVAPDWRARGVGTALMLAAEDWARAQGAERMILDLDANNTGALRLYERLGYEVHGHQMDKPLDPEPGAAVPEAGRDEVGDAVPTLEGELATLRPIRPDDREALLEVLRDPSVVAVWDTRGAEVSADELLAGDEGWTVWAIEVDGELAGSIQAAEELDPDYRKAGIDIFMHSRFQGRGIGTDAVRTLARYLFDVRGHHRLTIDPAADNDRAIRTYEKVGFKPVGVMRRYERGVDGTFHDGLLMDMVKGELR
jgi:aminoglycoside 6'-N-acetyltransferase